MRNQSWRFTTPATFSNKSVAAEREALSMAIEVLGVEHIDLTVNDVTRSRAFYDKVLGELGFRKFEGDDYIHWANPQMTIAIREASGVHRDAEFDRYRVGLLPMALRARARAEIGRFP